MAKKHRKHWLVVLVVLVIALLLYIPLQPKEPPEPEENITKPVENVTVVEGIQKGNLVKINFVLSLEDGTVVDTNNVTLAEQYGVKNYVKGPFVFIARKSGKVKGFDDAIIGLKEGEITQKIIEPSEEVLFVNNSRREKIVRQQGIPTLQKFPISRYKEFFNKPPIKGDVVFNPELLFKYQVVNITEKYAIAKILVKLGDEFTLQGNHWKSKVLDLGDRVFIVVHNPEANQTFETKFGTATIELEERSFYIVHEPELGRILNHTIETGLAFQPIIEFEIIEITEDSFILRRINYLPQERLTLDVEVLEVQEI